MEIATKEAYRELTDWSFQSIRYTLATASLTRKQVAPPQEVNLSQQTEQILREIVAKVKAAIDASREPVALDIIFCSLVFDWSAEHLGYVRKLRWWRMLQPFRKCILQKRRLLPAEDRQIFDPVDAAAMHDWACITIRNCGNLACWERLRRFPTPQELEKAARHARTIADNLWNVAFDHCKQMAGPLAFDAYYLPVVLDWCAQHRGFVR